MSHSQRARSSSTERSGHSIPRNIRCIDHRRASRARILMWCGRDLARGIACCSRRRRTISACPRQRWQRKPQPPERLLQPCDCVAWLLPSSPVMKVISLQRDQVAISVRPCHATCRMLGTRERTCVLTGHVDFVNTWEHSYGERVIVAPCRTAMSSPIATSPSALPLTQISGVSERTEKM